MGTNYYLEINCCAHCGHSQKKLHIGKSHEGHVFKLHVSVSGFHDPDTVSDIPIDLAHWGKLITESNNTVRDEYGMKVGKEALLCAIQYPPHTAQHALVVDGAYVLQGLKGAPYDLCSTRYFEELEANTRTVL